MCGTRVQSDRADCRSKWTGCDLGEEIMLHEVEYLRSVMRECCEKENRP